MSMPSWILRVARRAGTFEFDRAGRQDLRAAQAAAGALDDRPGVILKLGRRERVARALEVAADLGRLLLEVGKPGAELRPLAGEAAVALQQQLRLLDLLADLLIGGDDRRQHQAVAREQHAAEQAHGQHSTEHGAAAKHH